METVTKLGRAGEAYATLCRVSVKPVHFVRFVCGMRDFCGVLFHMSEA